MSSVPRHNTGSRSGRTEVSSVVMLHACMLNRVENTFSITIARRRPLRF